MANTWNAWAKRNFTGTISGGGGYRLLRNPQTGETGWIQYGIGTQYQYGSAEWDEKYKGWEIIEDKPHGAPPKEATILPSWYSTHQPTPPTPALPTPTPGIISRTADGAYGEHLKTTPVPTPAGVQGGMPPSPELRDKTRKPGFAPYEGYGWQWNDTVNQWQQVKNGAYGEHLKTITPHPEPQKIPIEGFGNYGIPLHPGHETPIPEPQKIPIEGFGNHGIPLAPGYKPTTPTTPAREAPISPVTPTAPVTVSKMPSDLLEQAKAFEATLGTSWKSFGETPASGAIQGRHRADISSLVPGIKRM